MNILEQKNEYINDIFLLTKKAHGYITCDDEEKIDKIAELILKREEYIKKIEEIDKLDSKKEFSNLNREKDIKSCMIITLNNIAKFDMDIHEFMLKEKKILQSNIKDTNNAKKGLLLYESNLQTSSFEVSQ